MYSLDEYQLQGLDYYGLKGIENNANKIMFYDKGNEFISVTGGWTSGTSGVGGVTYMNISKLASYMEANMPPSRECDTGTGNKIDLTLIKRIYIDWEVVTARTGTLMEFSVRTARNQDFPGAVVSVGKDSTVTGRSIQSIDVSALTGQYFLETKLHANNTVGTNLLVRIYSIWPE